MRRGLLIALAAIVLVPILTATATATAAWLWFDPAVIRAHLQDSFARATGKGLVIDGPITLGWGARLRIEGLRLLNPPGLSRPDLARAASAEIGVALLPLLWGRVVLRGVRLDGADMLLERDAAGRGNWERPPAPAATNTPVPKAPARRPRLEVVLDSATATNVTVAYRDAGRVWTVAVPRLAVADGRSVTGQVVLAGVPITVAGNGPFPLAVQLTADRVPVSELTFANVRLTLAVEAPDAPLRIDGAGTLGGAPVTLAAGASSLGAAAQGSLDRVSLSLGEATIAATGKIGLRAMDAQLGVRVSSVAAVGTALGRMWPDARDGTMQMHVVRNGAAVTLSGTAALAGSDAAFQLAASWPRPRLEGSVTSNRLDLDQLFAPPTSQVSAAPAATPPAATATSPAPAPEPPRPLPFATLNRADGDVQLTVATVRWHGTDVTGVTGRAVLGGGVLGGGVLTLDPVHAIVGGGPVDARLVADAAAQRVTVTMLTPGVDLRAAAALAGNAAAISGRGELDLALDGTGADAPALLATATGRIGLALVGGEADLSAIPGLQAAITQVTRGAMAPIEGRTPIRCLALRGNLAAGRAAVAALVLDTPRLTLNGDGEVGLADRTLALQLHPAIAVGGTSVSAPVRVTGTWAAPVIKMENDGGRASLSIAPTQGADLCGPALALARNGRAGPLPPADKPKPTKPADLLRSLLR